MDKGSLFQTSHTCTCVILVLTVPNTRTSSLGHLERRINVSSMRRKALTANPLFVSTMTKCMGAMLDKK